MNFKDNDQKYDQERDRRRKLENDNEERILKKITEAIQCTTSHVVSFERYDKEWFAVLSPESNNWVRGCPDFRIKVADESGALHYIFAELKVKDREYLKTIKGGLTSQQTVIPKYGCSSFYLDRTPVWKNMNVFCDKVGMPKLCFLVFFAKPDASEINCISLETINKMVSSSTWTHPVTGESMEFMRNYKEGYGQECFLIPKLKSKGILHNDFLFHNWQKIALKTALSPDKILPEIKKKQQTLKNKP